MKIKPTDESLSREELLKYDFNLDLAEKSGEPCSACLCPDCRAGIVLVDKVSEGGPKFYCTVCGSVYDPPEKF